MSDFYTDKQRMDYESWTGTSGVAFRDKRTGEVIIAYTGTNPNLANLSWE